MLPQKLKAILIFLAQNWKYDRNSQKLKNQNGDWKYESYSDFDKMEKINRGAANYFTLQNGFNRFLTAEVISFKDLQSYSMRKSFLVYIKGKIS